MTFRMPWIAVREFFARRRRSRWFDRRMRGYHPWYAWRPVRLRNAQFDHGTTRWWAWLEVVTRKPHPGRDCWAHYFRDASREAVSRQRNAP